MKAIRNQTAIALLAATMCGTAIAADRTIGEKFDDAWIDGSIETAMLFNSHLNEYSIRSEVENGKVTLSGNVDSDIDRSLAGEIAKGVDGVKDVDNKITVGGDKNALDKVSAKASERGQKLRQWANDATTTAEIKTRLLANSNTHGLQINVDTKGDVVTLTGKVASKEEAALAEQIASNVESVDEVNNRLVVASR
ncbi:MAG TPA: BON domain-containing protein [Fontimonas sp.]